MGILTKKTFWAAVVAVLIIVIRYYMPGIPVTDEILATLLTSGIVGILLMFGIVVDTSEAALAKFSATLLTMQERHQNEMKTLYREARLEAKVK